LRKKMAVAHSEIGVEVVARSDARVEAVARFEVGRPRMRQWHALDPGSRMAGGDGTAVSRVIEERERAWGRKIARYGEREREHGAWNFRARDLMRDVPLLCMSPFF
jgi:hypothetical protein